MNVHLRVLTQPIYWLNQTNAVLVLDSLDQRSIQNRDCQPCMRDNVTSVMKLKSSQGKPSDILAKPLSITVQVHDSLDGGSRRYRACQPQRRDKVHTREGCDTRIPQLLLGSGWSLWKDQTTQLRLQPTICIFTRSFYVAVTKHKWWTAHGVNCLLRIRKIGAKNPQNRLLSISKKSLVWHNLAGTCIG